MRIVLDTGNAAYGQIQALECLKLGYINATPNGSSLTWTKDQIAETIARGELLGLVDLAGTSPRQASVVGWGGDGMAGLQDPGRLEWWVQERNAFRGDAVVKCARDSLPAVLGALEHSGQFVRLLVTDLTASGEPPLAPPDYGLPPWARLLGIQYVWPPKSGGPFALSILFDDTWHDDQPGPGAAAALHATAAAVEPVTAPIDAAAEVIPGQLALDDGQDDDGQDDDGQQLDDGGADVPLAQLLDPAGAGDELNLLSPEANTRDEAAGDPKGPPAPAAGPTSSALPSAASVTDIAAAAAMIRPSRPAPAGAGDGTGTAAAAGTLSAMVGDLPQVNVSYETFPGRSDEGYTGPPTGPPWPRIPSAIESAAAAAAGVQPPPASPLTASRRIDHHAVSLWIRDGRDVAAAFKGAGAPLAAAKLGRALDVLAEAGALLSELGR